MKKANFIFRRLFAPQACSARVKRHGVRKEEINIKRLRYYLDRVADRKTTTYRYYANENGRLVQKELYDGECKVVYAGRPDKSGTSREPTFWHCGIAYTLKRTHKLALDRPTVTISIPVEMLLITDTTMAAADFCLRTIKPFFDAINEQYANRSRPEKENGKFILHEPGSTVLVRNTAFFAVRPAKDYEDLKGATILINPDAAPPPPLLCLNIRMEVQLPYMKIDRAKTMLCKQMPDAAERFVRGFDLEGLQTAVELEKSQQAIREFLRQSDYCSFIANGSILARERGSDLPARHAIPFQSPQGSEIETAGIRGMGIKRGVTVITGGGYSGKSTVLNAISAGIYNHASGDGRELCITDDTAVTITAEDGRSVSHVNISPFIKWLPGGDPNDFSTTHASGSTSQGANIMEAVSLGTKLLLIDEDRSATNFMIRDGVMKKLIQKEPITPFTDRVRELADMGIATILVIGGSGEYLSVADRIYMMDEFAMGDATAQAKALALAESPTPSPACWHNFRTVLGGFSSYPKGGSRERLSISDTGFIVMGDERIDIRNLHNIATNEQVNALAFMLRYMAKSTLGVDELEALALSMRGLSPRKPLDQKEVDTDILECGKEMRFSAPLEVDLCGKPGTVPEDIFRREYVKVDELCKAIEADGLDLIDTSFFTSMNHFMDMPRRFELQAAINRLRFVVWKKNDHGPEYTANGRVLDESVASINDAMR